MHQANNGPTGAVQFNDVTAPQPGDYTIKISYLNWDATDRAGYLSVNGAAPIKLAFPPSGGTNSTNVATARIHLNPGGLGNTLRFFNDDAAAPNIDKISVPDSIQ